MVDNKIEDASVMIGASNRHRKHVSPVLRWTGITATMLLMAWGIYKIAVGFIFERF